MKVNFICHSTFLVETESVYLLFDYFEGDLPQLDNNKPVYAFASHGHYDHFSPLLFNIEVKKYILSDDIAAENVPETARERTVFVLPHQRIKIDNLEIETLRSTDEGVAFFVKTDEKWLYHAGDLNCWMWEGAPGLQNMQMALIYREELKILENKKIVAAFVPLDPRLEMNYDKGMLYFLQTAEAKHIFPMHMWGNFSGIELFKRRYPDYMSKIMPIKQNGDVFEI